MSDFIVSVGRGIGNRPVFFGLVGLFIVIPVVWLVIVLLFALIRKAKSPEKKLWPFCIINEMLIPIRNFRLPPYKYKYGFDGSCKKAMKIAQMKYKIEIDMNDTDAAWGKEKDCDFTENYKTIMDSPNFKSMKFHNLGLVMAQKEMDSVCIRRLMFQAFLKKNPEISNIPIKSPCFVIGLPRTGTTWLSRCLAKDPNVNAPQLWELLRPIPENLNLKRETEDDWKNISADRAKRLKSVKELLDTRKWLGDSAMDHIHEVDAENHEECLWAMSDDMPLQMHMLYSDYMEDERFLTQMTNESVKRTYAYYKKQLQIIAWQKEKDLQNPKRFLLKSPLHLFYMRGLGEVFPDAKVVWTHREPENAVPSLGSLLKSVHQLYFEPECRDDAKLGSKLSSVTETYLKKCPADIAAANLDCKHVYYGDTTAHCIETIKSIYEHFGWEFTKEYEEILVKFEKEENEKRAAMAGQKDVLHKYSPEEFSLTAESLNGGGFKAYLDQYCTSCLPQEKHIGCKCKKINK